jgi:CheY-like chemotaxis protein
MRVLVVDDEAPARQRLVDLLHKDPQVKSIEEAVNGLAAVEAIHELRPEVVLLDVQMPELDGFGVIDSVGAEEMPLTIFVTAYDAHAIRAFEANALDYLLKPIVLEELRSAMSRVKVRLDERSLRDFGQKLAKLVAPASKRGEVGPLGGEVRGNREVCASGRDRLDRSCGRVRKLACRGERTAVPGGLERTGRETRRDALCSSSPINHREF